MNSSLDETAFFLKIDSKKQNEILKILELIRLKSPSVKISSDSKYKINLEITLSVAKYLQFLNDSIDHLSSSEPLIERDKILKNYGQNFIILNSEVNKSPKEKQFYIKNYLIKYWNFILKQLIKLKQISYSVEDFQDDAVCDMSILNESTINKNFLANQLNLFDNYFIFYKSNEKGKISPDKILAQEMPKNENIKLFSPKSISIEFNSANRYDSVIQSALLNLVLIYSLPDFPTDEMNTFQNLDEAINIFDSVDESLRDKWTNELDTYHLQVNI